MNPKKLKVMIAGAATAFGTGAIIGAISDREKKQSPTWTHLLLIAAAAIVVEMFDVVWERKFL